MNPSIYPNIQQQQPTQQPYNYQQPPPMSNIESQPIHGAPRSRCPCNIRRKLLENPQKAQKFVLIFNLALSVLMCLFATGFLVVLSVLPKVAQFALGIAALKERRQVQMLWGIHIGFTLFSFVYTVALAFHDWFTFLLGMILLVGEVMSLVYGATIAKAATENNQSSLDVVEDDINDINPQEEQSQQEPVYNQQPIFQEVYPSQPQAPIVQQYQQQPQMHYPSHPVQHFQPAPVSQPPMHSDEALFQKFAVQLSLLSEMSFSQNYQQKVRNARLLEKHNGNIQAVVAEIVQEGQ